MNLKVIEGFETEEEKYLLPMAKEKIFNGYRQPSGM